MFSTKLEKINDLLKTVSNPMSFLGSVNGIETFDTITNSQVDHKLTKNFNSNKPSQFNILKGEDEDLDIFTGKTL